MKNPFSGLFRARDKPRDVVSAATTFSFGGSSAGKSVTPRNAIQVSVVYACVRVIAETIASLPFAVYEETDKGSIKAPDHPLYRIIHDEPNSEMTSFVWREAMLTHLLLWGNSYSQIIRSGRGKVIGLYPLLPDHMEVDRDDKTGKLTYTYSTTKGETVRLRPEDVLHIPGLGFDGIMGYSPIAIEKNAIGLGIAAEEYGSKFFSNGATPSGILTHPNTVKNPKALREAWIENSHPAIVTKEQWDLVQVELERRSRMPGRFSPKGPLGSRLVCTDCGGFFGAKTWHSSDPYKTVIWRCNDKYRPGIERKSGGEKCCTGHVTEEKVMATFSNIVADLIARKSQVIEACEAILHELLDSSATDERRKRLEQEGDAIAKEIETLVERQARETVDGFADKYQELEKRYRRIEEKLKAAATDRQDRAYRAKQAELFLETLKRLPEQAKLESTELFMSLVDKVIVGDGLTFIMRDGTKRKVNGVR